MNFLTSSVRPQLSGLCAALGLAICAGLGLSSTAQAAELIEVRYRNTVVNVTIDELQRFALNGIVPPSIDQLLSDSDKIPSEVQDLLTEEIRISSRLVDRTVNSSTGDFLLMQLDEAIDGSSAEDDVEALRATLVEAFEDDNRLSVLELLERYPDREIQVDLTSLEGAYKTAVRVVRDIQPALDVAKEFLQDIICDCDTASQTDGTAIEVADHRADANCNPELLQAEGENPDMAVEQDAIALENNPTTEVE